MFKDVLAYALPVLGWWLLTGIINLAFAYKSQIEAWAESNPRLASLLKLSRALGFDPWNFLSSLKLLASKKLPDAQKADSPIGRRELRKAELKKLDFADPVVVVPPPPSGPSALMVLLVAGMALGQARCAGDKPQPPCDAATLAVLTGECSAAAARCVAQGGSEEECGGICDERLDARAERCR